ncbi:MAG TPA: multicopper oxidase domain-containing protein [Blastocatellia bacterium]
MKSIKGTFIAGILSGAVIFVAAQICAYGQGTSSPGNPCPRFAPGSTITEPEDIFSQDGQVTVNFSYFTFTDSNGLVRFCFINSDSAQSPTLHVHPGDTINVNVTNDVPADAAQSAIFSQIDKAGRYRKNSLPQFAKMLDMMRMHPEDASTVCGAAEQTATSLNIHYHGTNTSPTCHQDEVIHTLINSGQTFQYSVHIPTTEPPGMYWYHPHVHGIAEAAVQGGASGAIVVEGIENVQPAVAGLPERILNIRDQPIPGAPTPTSPPAQNADVVPSWDVTTNYVVDAYTAGPNGQAQYTPAVIPIKPNEKQFWRVVNACADTILDLQLVYNGTPQTFQIVSYDGVPAGSQDGTHLGTLVPATDVVVPPAGRVEFIMTGPPANVRNAQFVTNFINTGPDGDEDPTRPLAQLQVSQNAPEPPLTIPATNAAPGNPMFPNLASVTPNTQRLLYFSENSTQTVFFITVNGATPTPFSPTNPPAIVTTQGSVEDWTIQNRAMENHEFHMHQIHFLLMAINGVPVPPAQQQFFDMYQVPFWSGTGPYPSITVRMDFRGADIGDFVYHCHILGHEDAGMMAIIQVNPSGTPPASSNSAKAGAKTASAKETKTTNSAVPVFETNLADPPSGKAAAPASAQSKSATSNTSAKQVDKAKAATGAGASGQGAGAPEDRK